MDDKRYQGLEKRFHKFQEKHLRDISALNDLPYGSAATTCKALVEKAGIDKSEEILNEFQTSNNIELITSAYFDAEDFDKSHIPVKFVDLSDLYSPGTSVECKLEIDSEFVRNVSRRDWVGLFEEGWKYLHSYITFEWVSVPESLADERNSMKVVFNSKTLPKKPKDEGHVFCYVTRTGDVLGVSKTFHFKNPGISFTDPDTFLVEGDMLASINQTDISQISIDMPSLTLTEAASSPDAPSFDALSSQDAPMSGNAPSSQDAPVEPIAPEQHESNDLTIQTLESELDSSRATLDAKEKQITKLETLAAELSMKLDAKAQQQESVETASFENIRELERELNSIKLKKQNLVLVNGDLEQKIMAFSETIREHEMELDSTRQHLVDSQNFVSDLQEEMFQKKPKEEENEAADRCKIINEQKALLENALDSALKEKSQLESIKDISVGEINKLTMLVKSKDDVINKLVVAKRDSDGALVTFQAEASQHKNESSRLLGELNSCIKQLKQCEAALYSAQIKQRQLQTDTSELPMVRNAAQSLQQKVTQLELRNQDLETTRISLQDGEMATGTVLSLQARIAHLEHLNNKLENTLLEAPTHSEMSTETAQEIISLREDVELKQKQLEAADDFEINYREGIKDLRGQLVKNALELEQRTEQLADKGEMIDGLRAECQERRETERYNKHRLSQLEKKIDEEAESYHQIISDLQSQLSGYTNSHIQFERHGLVKCPFCPAAYERVKEQEMEQHIQAKHPY